MSKMVVSPIRTTKLVSPRLQSANNSDEWKENESGNATIPKTRAFMSTMKAMLARWLLEYG